MRSPAACSKVGYAEILDAPFVFLSNGDGFALHDCTGTRIVAKVDELMALCDELEASLTRTQTESRRLLDAVMAQIGQ